MLLGVICLKYANLNFQFWCVGRGVLRFWEGWYRKTRSNFMLFYEIWGSAGNLGVDIICQGCGFGIGTVL